MSFEDIDTPVADDVLSGGAEDPAAEPVPENVPAVAATPDPEPAAVEQDQEPEPQAERAQVIPRARFDEVNAKLHAEREENEALRAKLEALKQPEAQTAASVSVDDLERQYLAAIMGGEEDNAIAIRAKINGELQSLAEARATEKVMAQMSAKEAAATKAAEEARVAGVVSQALAAYEFLNPDSPAANQEAINEVIGWRMSYEAQGFSTADALQKAVGKVAPMYATTSAKVVPVDTRKQSAIDRNIQAANAQPPANVAGVGNRAAPMAPKIETQKDWESLSEAERERLLMEG